jgi:predicted 2-oxoglutarate/Fe(II)-dependent dioxygenase YbiX
MDALLQSLSQLSLPDVFHVSGHASSLPSVRLADGQLLDTANVDGLRRQCTPSHVGKRLANVRDESVRKSLELNATQFTVDWPALHAQILPHVATRLNVNWTLTAQPHKLLFYQVGSFFKPHRDAQHTNGHTLSLVVDLGSDADGGAVRFTHGRQSAEWASHTSAWACWFASVMHEVTPVTRGHRVVLTFDVIVTPPPATTRSLLAPVPKLGGVPPFAQLVWERIVSLLSVADHSALSRTCRGLHAMLGGCARLLGEHLRNHVDVEQLRSDQFSSLGFVARHTYLFEASDASNVVPTWQLKGRDRLIAEAARLCGWHVRVRRAFALHELTKDDEFQQLRRIRVGCAVLPNSSMDALVNLEDEAWRGAVSDEESENLRNRLNADIEGFRKLDGSFWYGLRSTDTDNDSERNILTVPFVGVRFCETMGSVAALAGPTPQMEEDDLWGNESMFCLRSFESAALLLDVIDPAEMPHLKWAPDLRDLRF